MHMALDLNPRTELESQETPVPQLGPPGPSVKQGLKMLSNIGCCRRHVRLAKHGQSHLNYCTEPESHARDFPVQSIPLNFRKLPRKEPLNFVHRGTKLAVLIPVGQYLKPSFGLSILINGAEVSEMGHRFGQQGKGKFDFIGSVLFAQAEAEAGAGYLRGQTHRREHVGRLDGA